MYLYTASPTRTADVTDDHPLFRVAVADKVCADLPYKITMLGDSRWSTLLSIDLTDAEFDALTDALIEAREKRTQQQRDTLAALTSKFAPEVDAVQFDGEPGTDDSDDAAVL